MVVPTVLAINARRNCALCSASGSGPAVMSNVVIMDLLGARQAGTCWKAFPLHPRKWMLASTASFLLGRQRHCAHRGSLSLRRPILHGERRQPFAITGANIPQMARSNENGNLDLRSVR